MTLKVNKKITGYAVKSNKQPETNVQVMHEDVKRPEQLIGSTYKIKTPNMPDAMYITINDIVLNQGTEYESRHPYEMFINSKNMVDFQWINALTMVISAVFRKSGEIGFLADELKAIYDPKGGFFYKGKYINSLVSMIGDVLENHIGKVK